MKERRLFEYDTSNRLKIEDGLSLRGFSICCEDLRFRKRRKNKNSKKHICDVWLECGMWLILGKSSLFTHQSSDNYFNFFFNWKKSEGVHLILKLLGVLKMRCWFEVFPSIVSRHKLARGWMNKIVQYVMSICNSLSESRIRLKWEWAQPEAPLFDEQKKIGDNSYSVSNPNLHPKINH